MSIRAQRLLRVSITSADLARIEVFYREALDFTPISEQVIEDPAWFHLMGVAGVRARALRMRLGAQELEFLSFDPPGRPYPPGSTAHDLWFQHVAIVVNDIGNAWDRLRLFDIVPVTEGGPQRLPPNTGSVTAFKFRDPEGHPLELIQFPPGTGDPLWQERHGRALFLGVDHSAIAVRDGRLSTGFYKDILGLAEASRSVNRGPEQDRLDATPNVVVDVVALRPAVAATPHVELLGYRVPPISDAVPMLVRDVGSARLVVECAGLPEPCLIADPDGHQVLLVREP